MAKTMFGGGRSVSGGPRGRWLVGILATVGTLVLAYALSLGLRADLGSLAALLAPLGVCLGPQRFRSLVRDLLARRLLFHDGRSGVRRAGPVRPVSLAGSLVSGVWEGFGLSLVGSIVGSVLAFLAVRRWGEPLVKRLVGEKTYRRYAGVLGGGAGGLSGPARPLRARRRRGRPTSTGRPTSRCA
jgi:hypothetical protein